MHTLKSRISTTNDTNNFSHTHYNQWFDIKSVNSTSSLFNEIALLCQRCQDNHKWVLVVSSNASDLMHLQQEQNVGKEKVLWVHANRASISTSNIERTLAKGNCAAVVICDAELNAQQREQLKQKAMTGNTHCVLLNSNF
ncbi:MAG: hypothetical protein MK214_01640 [Thalassotalea sp.]|nr:hypothetical protein [Thalassotalea sp.]